MTELDTDEVLISDYEVDAIVARVVKQVVSEIRFTATVTIAITAFLCGVVLSVLLG